ncbi:MAG: hypothetical protein PWQ12_718 [Clostridiales bacterium]|nr:hypothetical protein [Clostridiales bacterium]
MAIIHVRIDDRLVHGQVATMWTNYLGATRIMVVDNEAANSEIMKMSLKLATPTGVSLSVLPVEKAAPRILENRYEGQRVLMIIKSPMTLLKLVSLGAVLPAVNVGNLTYAEGKISVGETVAVSKAEIEAFRALHQKGVTFNMQLTPSHPAEDFIELLGDVR